MKALLSTLKNTIFKFDVNIGSCHTDEALFHLDFDEDKYSQHALIKLIKRSVMYFALTPQEFESMKDDELHEMSPTAWSRISTAHRNSKGDYGELLLYLILSAFYPAERFVTKVKLRSSQAEQIKGFDCAHFTLDEDGIVNFWLGEAKFHSSFSGAVQDAIESLTEHCNYPYIKKEFRVLAPNIEVNRESESYTKLMAALRNELPLDKLRFVFPILITYDSGSIKKSIAVDKKFKTLLTKEMQEKYDYIRKNWNLTKTNFRFVFILFPLAAVAELKLKLEAVEKAERDED